MVEVVVVVAGAAVVVAGAAVVVAVAAVVVAGAAVVVAGAAVVVAGAAVVVAGAVPCPPEFPHPAATSARITTARMNRVFTFDSIPPRFSRAGRPYGPIGRE